MPVKQIGLQGHLKENLLKVLFEGEGLHVMALWRIGFRGPVRSEGLGLIEQVAWRVCVTYKILW